MSFEAAHPGAMPDRRLLATTGSEPNGLSREMGWSPPEGIDVPKWGCCVRAN